MAKKQKKENKPALSIPGPPVGYVDLLDHEITEDQKREAEEYSKLNTTPYNPLRPSSAGKCARRLAYELMVHKGKAQYQTELKEPNVVRLLRLGHAIEWSVLRMFQLVKYMDVDMKQQKVKCFELDQLTEEEGRQLILGSVDACFLNTEWKCVMDVKSVKDAFSRSHKTRWDDHLERFSEMKSLVTLSDQAFYADDVQAFLKELGEDWLFENICQLNAYALSPFMKDLGVDHGVIYKYNKNDSRHYELRFRPSQELADYAKEKFNEVNKAVSKGNPELVEREYSLGSQHCSFCPYALQCWGQERDPKKEYFKTFPKKKWPTDFYKLKAKKEITNLFEDYEEAKKEEKKASEIEKQLTLLLTKEDVTKVKLENGHIYEVKRLKSPAPHGKLVIRRSKL